MDIRIISIAASELTTVEGDEAQQFLLTLNVAHLGDKVIAIDLELYARLKALISSAIQQGVGSFGASQDQEEGSVAAWVQQPAPSDQAGTTNPMGTLAKSAPNISDPIDALAQWQGQGD